MALPDVTLNIADALSTIGMQVSIKETAGSGQMTVIKWATDVGDLGGTPETLDATPLASKVQLNKSGIQAQDQFNITYYYNDDDYELLDGLVDKKGAWFTKGEIKVGQGHENAVSFVESNPDFAQELENSLRGQLFPNLVIRDKDGNPVSDKKKTAKKTEEASEKAAAKTEIPVQEGLF